MEDGSKISDLQVAELSPEEREKLLTKFVSERPLEGVLRNIVLVLAAALCLFHILNALQSGLFSMDLVRSIHLAAVLSLCFLMFPVIQKKRNAPVPIYDYILSILGLLVGLYGVIEYNGLLQRASIGYNTMDLVAAGIGVLVVMEAARRALNPALAIAAGLFILYALLGGYLSGPLSHPGYSVKAILEHLYISKEGIFGIPLYVSAMYVILFIIYGAVFDKCGAGKFFIDTAVSLTGRLTGGPAKVSCISSALFGMISGSSVANVMVDGVFNIPMMKRVGYKPEVAGAIEAATSTGGQIMPPVMGAAAFVMAEFLNIPYSRIIIAAAIPAVLYYVGLYIAIDLQARKQGIRGLPANEIPGLRKTFKEGWPFVVPIAMIVYLMETGYSPMLSVMASMFTVILLYIGRLLYANFEKAAGERRSLTLLGKEIGHTLWAALYEGGKGAVPVAIACASAGIIVGVVTMTGLGFKIGTLAISLSGGNLMIVLIMTMMTSLILGMGIPTTANYIITASIAAPAIISVMAANAGVTAQQFLAQFPEAALSAHLFAFYFGVAADLTPPVALAAYAGAAIAGADPMKTGVHSFLIGIGKYIVPYFFVFFPILLFTGFTPTPENFGFLFLIIMLTVASIFAINCGTIGYFLRPVKPLLRVVFIVVGILMVLPSLELKIAGLTLTLIGCLYQALVKPAVKPA